MLTPTLLAGLMLSASGPPEASLLVDYSGELPRLGPGGPPLVGDVFYDFIGDTERRDAYRRTRYNLDHLGRIGSQSFGPGLLLAAVGAIGFSCPGDGWRCSPALDVLFWSGAAISLAGGICMTLAVAVDPDPLTLAERRALARQYNEQLRQRAAEPESNLRLIPVPIETGLTLVLSGTFLNIFE